MVPFGALLLGFVGESLGMRSAFIAAGSAVAAIGLTVALVTRHQSHEGLR